MNLLTMENFRCFRRRQNARLAPLTLLVGENSTGKTSVLALLRVLPEVVDSASAPSFKKPPFDLGSFDEIAHYRGGRGGRASEFTAGFSVESRQGPRTPPRHIAYEISFAKAGSIPVPTRSRVYSGNDWLEVRAGSGQTPAIRVGRGDSKWRVTDLGLAAQVLRIAQRVPTLDKLMWMLDRNNPFSAEIEFDAGVPDDHAFLKPGAHFSVAGILTPFAGAPVRSKPAREYSPDNPPVDPEGNYIPMYLHDLSLSKSDAWRRIKRRLNEFGRDSGVFDEIKIRSWGKTSNAPFQIQVRKSGDKSKGPWRNLIDVGYGVSQVLPVVTELLRDDAPRLFLLQQPEVHLHPSAQAALGSLFCEVAGFEFAGGGRRQLVVETHSDHLIDRVRMDVRDRSTSLKPEDVSILYFERDGQEVNIHSIGIDKMGNIVGAPDSYGRFFLEETERSVWGGNGG